MATKPNQAATNELTDTDPVVPTEQPSPPTAPDPDPATTSAAPATPDEFGRLRVRDRDTGHERTIQAAELPHGRYTVLNQRATDRSGDPLPPKHASS